MADEPEFAFPFTVPPSGGVGHVTHSGMTLRDYFAAAAMQGAVSRDSWSGENDDIARAAYVMADAMMRARRTYELDRRDASQRGE